MELATQKACASLLLIECFVRERAWLTFGDTHCGVGADSVIVVIISLHLLAPPT